MYNKHIALRKFCVHLIKVLKDKFKKLGPHQIHPNKETTETFEKSEYS